MLLKIVNLVPYKGLKMIRFRDKTMIIMILVVNLGFTSFYYKVKSRTQFWIGHFFKDY